jgi:DNA invertase Pin-like site-specific DNA recombinase
LDKFKTAIYCRISNDDANNQSESIDNQQLIIRHYINSHSDEFAVVDTFIDDGISGMTYDREAYTRMMTLVDEGRINAIIVKDLSRIGREQIETLNLIKKEFILKNVRFIAITDDYDSFNTAKSDGLGTSVKLLLNDYYCADISKKVRSAQRAKMARGDFIGSYAPYGYIKSSENKNKLVVDEEAAAVVRKIFNLYIGGMGKLAIAKALNSEGIPNPTMYKRTVLKQNYKNANRLSQTGYWTYSTINKILSNPVYTGLMIQHKTEIKAKKIRKKVQLPKNDWVIVENTHEPIIDQEIYKIAYDMLQNKRTQEPTGNMSKYTGLFFCKECGRVMNKFLSKPKKDGSRYITFKCGSYSRLGKDICTIHSIKESELDELVLTEIKRNIKAALNAESCEYIRRNTLRELQMRQKNTFNKLRDRLEACAQKRKTMLKYLSESVITMEDFKHFDADNKNEVEAITAQIETASQKSETENYQLRQYNLWVDNLLKYKDINELNREVLVNLVDRIYISEQGDNKEIEIVFRFKNPLE